VKIVEELSKAVGGNLDAIKAAEDESARAELEKEQKAAHGIEVQESKNQVKDLTGRLKTSNAELKKLESSAKKAEGVQKELIDSDISQLRPKIKLMESDLSKAQEVSTSKFQFKAPASPVAGKKGDSQAHKFLGDTRESKLQIMIPKEALPDAGTLYLEGDNRYLAISNWEEVAPARKDAKRLNATLCATREVLG
jgi:dynactin complex subunit